MKNTLFRRAALAFAASVSALVLTLSVAAPPPVAGAKTTTGIIKPMCLACVG